MESEEVARRHGASWLERRKEGRVFQAENKRGIFDLICGSFYRPMEGVLSLGNKLPKPKTPSKGL
jgi:hypothetical protein